MIWRLLEIGHLERDSVQQATAKAQTRWDLRKEGDAKVSMFWFRVNVVCGVFFGESEEVIHQSQGIYDGILENACPG